VKIRFALLARRAPSGPSESAEGGPAATTTPAHAETYSIDRSACFARGENGAAPECPTVVG